MFNCVWVHSRCLEHFQAQWLASGQSEYNRAQKPRNKSMPQFLKQRIAHLTDGTEVTTGCCCLNVYTDHIHHKNPKCFHRTMSKVLKSNQPGKQHWPHRKHQKLHHHLESPDMFPGHQCEHVRLPSLCEDLCLTTLQTGKQAETPSEHLPFLPLQSGHIHSIEICWYQAYR